MTAAVIAAASIGMSILRICSLLPVDAAEANGGQTAAIGLDAGPTRMVHQPVTTGGREPLLAIRGVRAAARFPVSAQGLPGAARRGSGLRRPADLRIPRTRRARNRASVSRRHTTRFTPPAAA